MACTEHRERDSSTCHIAVRGCLPGPFVWAACYQAWHCHFALSESVCASVTALVWVSLCVCVTACITAPRRGPVGWQRCPVVVTVPGAASGTIWPLWKSSAGVTSEQACKRKTKETRMIQEQPELSNQDRAERWEGKNPTLHCVLACRHMNLAVSKQYGLSNIHSNN